MLHSEDAAGRDAPPFATASVPELVLLLGVRVLGSPCSFYHYSDAMRQVPHYQTVSSCRVVAGRNRLVPRKAIVTRCS